MMLSMRDTAVIMIADPFTVKRRVHNGIRYNPTTRTDPRCNRTWVSRNRLFVPRCESLHEVGGETMTSEDAESFEISNINNYEELTTCSPETVKFHSTFKGIARMLIKYLPFSQIDERTYAKHLKGNPKVFYEIIKKWESLDGRQHRKDVLTKPLKVGLFTMANDSDFREVFNFMAYELIQRRNELYFPPHHTDPTCWTNDKTNLRHTPGVYLTRDRVLVENTHSLVLNVRLPLRLYWCAIKPELNHFYAINSNHLLPGIEGCYTYAVLKDYGNEASFNGRIVMGD